MCRVYAGDYYALNLIIKVVAMRKLSCLLICFFLIHTCFAQSYLEPLSQLNNYFQKNKSFLIKQVDVKDGYLFFYKSYGNDFERVELKDLGAAVDNLRTEVNASCLNNAKCLFKSSIKSKTTYLYFYTLDSVLRIQLVAHLNNFISSYDKDFGIAYTPKSSMGCVSGNCQNGLGVFVYADSSEYYGEWKNGKRDGKATLSKKDGTKILGIWENEEPTGNTTIIYPNKDRYIGAVKNELPNGKGLFYKYNANYKDKTTLAGNFVNGIINGPGEFDNLIMDTKYELKKESYIGSYKDGLYDGLGIYLLTSHFPKASHRGLDDTVRYEGGWKNGKKDGSGFYLNNHVYESEEYTGEWKNGLKNGKGVCRDKIYDADLKVGKMRYGNTFDGTFLNGSEDSGKLTNNYGAVLYNGGKKERDAYWAEIKKTSDQQDKWRAEEWEKGRKDREDLAERNATNAKNAKACLCNKCGGSGKMTIRSTKIWDSDVYENGTKVGTARNSGWEYEDIKCTRCLGTGKCK
jgi:hypothetical protein